MTRLISTMIILTLVVVTGLVLARTGASGAAEIPGPALVPSQPGAPAPIRTATPTGESTPGTVTAPRTGGRPVSDNNPTAWQASGQTSSPDADPLTEAGRWELFGSGTLNDVFFVDSSYGWAAGTGVWKTTDGGATWRRLPSMWGTSLRRIIFADRNRGWALQHATAVQRTEDGGETWGVTFGGSPYSSVLEYQPPNDLWAVGQCTEYYYPDPLLGTIWLIRRMVGRAGGPLRPRDMSRLHDGSNGSRVWISSTVHMVGSSSGGRYRAGESELLLLEDREDPRTTAKRGPMPACRSPEPSVISFGSATHGWIATARGCGAARMAGDTWAEQHTFAADITWLQAGDARRPGSSTVRSFGAPPTAARPGSTSPTPRLPGCLSGPRWRGGGRTDAASTRPQTLAETWRGVFALPPARQADWFWDALTGWRSAGATIERTTDGGATWQSAATGLQGIDAFQFVDARVGWAWHAESLGLAHTTDGGATWQSQDTGSPSLTDLQFVDANHGWVRDGLQIRRTTDGGNTWHDFAAPPDPQTDWSYIRYQLLFADATHGWAFRTGAHGPCMAPGYYALLSHTTDGGSSWGPDEGIPADNIFFLDRERGFGWYNRCDDRDHASWSLSRTADGGRTWREILWGESGAPSGLYTPDMERVWSSIGYSSDGGFTWTGQRAQAPYYAGSVSFDRTGRAFAPTTGGLLWYRATEVTAYRAADAPQIDGNLADWAGVPAYVLNADRAYRVLWATPTPLDASATLQAAWDAGNLYFAIRVYDDAIRVDSGAQPWLDDAVEIGLDGRHDHVRNWELDDDRQFTVTALGQIYESGNLLTDVPVARVGTSNGYILEFAIPKANWANSAWLLRRWPASTGR